MTVTAIAKSTGRGRNEDVEALLRQHGLKPGHGPNTYTFLADVPTSSFDKERSLRNQARLGAAIQEDLASQYTLDMDRGDAFPAGISWLNEQSGLLELCDGNHRLEAAIRSSRTVATYLIDTSVETRVLITLEANLRHGRGATQADKLHHALYAIDNGMSIKRAAQKFLVEEKDVRSAVVEHRATRRADDLGIPPTVWENLKSGHRKRLVGIAIDPVFRAATLFTAEARLPQSMVNKFVSEIQRTPANEAAQLAVVDRWRDEMIEVVAEKSIGGTEGRAMQRRQGPRHKIRLALGFIDSLPDDPAKVLADFPAGEVPDVLTKVDAALSRMTALREALANA